ncbi:hypothetical protein RvY_05045 [Ramazzottius varieornatus]|uniref:Uncharacterized protein n=1 Tax=Ramazzottius varieornatus TaxID=947166 RepID=A0A1D1UTQ2_RAMVA|nr:hypothetical protein RvY_05045 [Ramazzottius varieornatus]
MFRVRFALVRKNRDVLAALTILRSLLGFEFHPMVQHSATYPAINLSKNLKLENKRIEKVRISIPEMRNSDVLFASWHLAFCRLLVQYVLQSGQHFVYACPLLYRGPYGKYCFWSTVQILIRMNEMIGTLKYVPVRSPTTLFEACVEFCARHPITIKLSIRPSG